MKIINFPKIFDKRGNLTFLQYSNQIPFEIKRVFWTYDVPSGVIRGGHAYYKQDEIIIALSGSFDVVVTQRNGKVTKFFLNRPNRGLYIPAMTWRQMENFSTNSVGLHLSSSVFNENDYLRDFEFFQKLANEEK